MDIPHQTFTKRINHQSLINFQFSSCGRRHLVPFALALRVLNYHVRTKLEDQAMRLFHAALIALLIAPTFVIAEDNLGTYEDRIAVEDVMARYVWAVDSLDADGYVAVFTADAIIDSNGTISKGHDEIRKVVTNLIKRRDDNKAKGVATANLYHVISNVRITFPKAGEAIHYSYWQTVRRDENNRMVAAAMGRSEDHLVKQKGKWLIQSRKLTVFTD
jgi:ketosteroid isomerase-like protein